MIDFSSTWYWYEEMCTSTANGYILLWVSWVWALRQIKSWLCSSRYLDQYNVGSRWLAAICKIRNIKILLIWRNQWYMQVVYLFNVSTNVLFLKVGCVGLQESNFLILCVLVNGLISPYFCWMRTATPGCWPPVVATVHYLWKTNIRRCTMKKYKFDGHRHSYTIKIHLLIEGSHSLIKDEIFDLCK